MLFEWDEQKRDKVRRERGIDFVPLAEAAFDGRPTVSVASSRDGEERFVTITEYAGRLFALVWTPRGDAVRIVTARRARDGETRHFRARHG